MNCTATIERRDKGARVVLLEADGQPVGCVWFNKPYRGISCGQLRWIDSDFNRHENIIFAFATPESVLERAEFIINKYILSNQ
jgi:hypothetical protein